MNERLTEPLHLRATLLPDGDASIDLWIVDGRITFVPQPGASALTAPGGFVTAGLVDAHSHADFIGQPTDPHGPEVIRANLRRHLEAGTLLVRDLGSISDDLLALTQEPGLPRVQAAGLSLLVEERWPFFVTSPGELTSATAERARAGAGWVKIFADWPGWPGRQEEPPFGPQDPVSYSTETLTDAVRAAHAAGARVAIHAFGREAASVGIEAGVDSIEHGWGLDEELLERMAARKIAWAPLFGIALPMKRGAISGRTGDLVQAQWIDETLERMPALLAHAQRVGVVILAGTDWFPAVTLADELKMLHSLGMSPRAALATATTAARAYLGVADISEGAIADLVIYREDPREDLTRVTRPELVMRAGHIVAGRARPS